MVPARNLKKQHKFKINQIRIAWFSLCRIKYCNTFDMNEMTWVSKNCKISIKMQYSCRLFLPLLHILLKLLCLALPLKNISTYLSRIWRNKRGINKLMNTFNDSCKNNAKFSTWNSIKIKLHSPPLNYAWLKVIWGQLFCLHRKLSAHGVRNLQVAPHHCFPLMGKWPFTTNSSFSTIFILFVL